MFTKSNKPQETQNIVSFPILGSLGIRSANTKEQIAKVPAVQKTKKGDLKMMSSLINSSVFPGCQGGPLEHLIGAKAVAFSEIMDNSFLDYVKQVKMFVSIKRSK